MDGLLTTSRKNDFLLEPEAFVAVIVKRVFFNAILGLPEKVPLPLEKFNPEGKFGAMEYLSTFPPRLFTVFLGALLAIPITKLEFPRLILGAFNGVTTAIFEVAYSACTGVRLAKTTKIETSTAMLRRKYFIN